MMDKITESQEWIDGLVKEYSPESEDIDVCIQNMGIRIKQLTEERGSLLELKQLTASLYHILSTYGVLSRMDINQLGDALKATEPPTKGEE